MNARVVRSMLSVALLLVCASPVLAQIDDETLKEVTEVGLRWAAKSVDDVVPGEQREALGLDDTTWTKQYGKAHPDVYEALKKAEEIGERAKKAREAYLDPAGFGGKVYVQVHLKHEQKGKASSTRNKAAIKRLQTEVLSQLSAAEFYARYPLQTLPGILGYADRTALEKLKANPDAVAICLDDKPFPEQPPHVFKADLPPIKPGDPAAQVAEGRLWGSGGKVEREVFQALGIHERVFVIVILNAPRRTVPLSDEVLTENRVIENKVLSSLTADEFWLQARTRTLFGLVNKDGLTRLENHPEVRCVGMEDAMIPVPRDMKKRP